MGDLERGSSAVKPTVTYARLWGRTVGKNFLRAALPGLFAVLVAAVLVFPGSGLRADYVTSHSLRTGAIRFSLALGWLSLTMPAARVVLTNPQVHWFRSLPLARWQLLVPVVAALLVLNSPWWILWWRGESLTMAVAALAVVTGSQSQWLVGLSNWRHAGVWLGLAGGWGLLPFAGAPFVLAALGGYAVARAFREATDGPSPGRSCVVGERPGIALCSALFAAGFRANGSALLRLVALLATALGCLALGLSNNPHWMPGERLRWVGAAWIGVWSLGALILARPLCTAEGQLGWVLSVTGVSLALRRACVLGSVAGAGGVLGLGLGACLQIGVPHAIGRPGGVPLPLELAAVGVGLGLFAGAVARWAMRGGGREALRWLLGWLVLCAVSLCAWLAA